MQKDTVNLCEQLPVTISVEQYSTVYSVPRGCINHAKNHTSAAPLPPQGGPQDGRGIVHIARDLPNRTPSLLNIELQL
jgi:hypothetical protein